MSWVPTPMPEKDISIYIWVQSELTFPDFAQHVVADVEVFQMLGAS